MPKLLSMHNGSNRYRNDDEETKGDKQATVCRNVSSSRRDQCHSMRRATVSGSFDAERYTGLEVGSVSNDEASRVITALDFPVLLFIR